MALDNPATSSGLKSASALIIDRPARLMGFQLNAGSATTTLALYDNGSAAASGTQLDGHTLASNSNSVSEWFGPNGIACNRGIYMALSGTGATVIVYYLPM